MLTITESAKEYLRKAIEDTGKKYAYLGVNGGGCSGFQYDWKTVNETTDGTLIL